jgi:hypothetical protein
VNDEDTRLERLFLFSCAKFSIIESGFTKRTKYARWGWLCQPLNEATTNTRRKRSHNVGYAKPFSRLIENVGSLFSSSLFAAHP